jgi:hypothetical protein
MRLLSLLLILMLAAGCGSDNAAPETHGAHNKPSDGGHTETETAPPQGNNPDSPPPAPGAEGTYAESGGSAGGDQKSKP